MELCKIAEAKVSQLTCGIVDLIRVINLTICLIKSVTI